MKIAIAADHAGYEYKKQIREWLEYQGYEVQDYGTNSTESCDYPDYALPAAKSVAANENDYGVFICGTGIGVAMAANKVKGVRAANCSTVEMARLARGHNNANVLTLGARLIDIELAREIITAFLNAPFEGGRHARRVEKVDEM